MKVKEESEKASFKFNIQKTKIMASCPITSWQIDEGKVETETTSIFLDSKITVHSDLLKQMCIASVMPSNHLILCCPLLLPPSIFPSIRVLSFFLSFFKLLYNIVVVFALH